MSAEEGDLHSLGPQVIDAGESVVGETGLADHGYDVGLRSHTADELLSLLQTTMSGIPTTGKPLGGKARTESLVEFAVPHLWEKELGQLSVAKQQLAAVQGQLSVALAEKDTVLDDRNQLEHKLELLEGENLSLKQEANGLKADMANQRTEMDYLQSKLSRLGAPKHESHLHAQTTPPPPGDSIGAAPPAGGDTPAGVGRGQVHQPGLSSQYGPLSAPHSGYTVPQPAHLLPTTALYPGYPQPAAPVTPQTDVYRMARSVKRFSPAPSTSYPVDAYLSDLRHHFKRCPEMSMEDKIFLIRLTSDGVGSLIDRKCNLIGDNYEKLEAAVRKEYTYNSQEAGIQLALSVKQGRAEDPQVFYQRLFNAYFGTECKDGMEEDKGFKGLFLENLHAHYGPYMGTVDPKTTPMDELRRMASCAFVRFGKIGKSSSSASVMALEDKDALQLEGAAYKGCKPKGLRAGPEQKWAQQTADRQQQTFTADNKRRDPGGPRTPPPARGGAPKSPQPGRVKRRVSFGRKGGSPGPYRRGSPRTGGRRTPSRTVSPHASRGSNSPSREPEPQSRTLIPEELRVMMELLRVLRSDSTARERILCVTAVGTPQPHYGSVAETSTAEAKPATMVRPLAPEALVTPAVVTSIDACAVAHAEPRTRPSRPKTRPNKSKPRPDEPNKFPQIVLGSLTRRGPMKKPHVPVTLSGVLGCEALIDTGSAYTVTSGSVWEQVRMAAESQGRNLTLAPCAKPIQSYSQTLGPLKGVAFVDLTLSHVRAPPSVGDYRRVVSSRAGG
uniref:Uncharacterized protein n=1 Tax=Nothobranchius furzeri TaxID=105023 RepID=A0A8C6KXN3_NOTFU